MRPRRLLVPLIVSALAALGLLVGSGTAFAHNVLVGSDPADGANLDQGPNKATLRFDLPVQAAFSVLTVIGPEGGHYEDGGTQVSGVSVSTAVRPLGPAGKYTIGYRVVSDDGHPVTGSVSFTLTKPGTGTPSASAPDGSAAPGPATAGGGSSGGSGGSGDDSGGAPVWPWIVGAVLLLGGGIAVALRAGRG